MKTIESITELTGILRQSKKSYILLWKKGSEQSECAFSSFSKAAAGHPDILTGTVDVSTVKDIHGKYGIATVPTLMQFAGEELKNVIRGCHQESYFRTMLEEASWHASVSESGKPAKSVTVYTTPTCSWCTTLKQWLRKNHVPYSEVDVSRDENAAKELVRRSGQQGVPQTDINGRIVVGFDQVKLKQLLEL